MAKQLKHLVIVESPAKSKTITKYLGKGFQVMASYGHLRDLPSSNIGIDVENDFEPSYKTIKGKTKLVNDLKKAVQKADKVWLATDPDREGEAIAWHFMHATNLEKEKTERIVFNEITKDAVLAAIENPRELNEDLVDAQQARRILDRLIGYKLSPILSKKIRRGLSAGRVQSVALKLLCEREREIQAFVPEEYWTIEVDLKDGKGNTLHAKAFAEGNDKNKLVLANEADAKRVVDILESNPYSIQSINKKDLKRNPAKPFTTSTLQQEAAKKLYWTANRTMRVAQQLYEGLEIDGENVGLITYMRTDSTRISDQSVANTKKLVEESFGKEYLGVSGQKKETKKDDKAIQDAHEAIRPSYVFRRPEDLESLLEEDQYKLYKLIWDRLVASQMAPAQLEQTSIIINSGDILLKVTGQVVKFDGFLKVYEETDEEKDGNDGSRRLPACEEGQPLTKEKLESEQKFTQPPRRYSEAALVKTLEEKGIGRPSTYAPTIGTIIERRYVDRDQRRLTPTKLGMVVDEKLAAFFSEIIDYNFTAQMETQLDEITMGKHRWQDIIKEFYSPFEKLIDVADEEMEKIKFGERTLGTHPETGDTVYVKLGRYGPMVQCGDFDDEDESVKPKFAGIPDDIDMDEIDLDGALKLFSLPREVGDFEGATVTAAIGRFGPYLKHQSSFVSLGDVDPYTVDIETSIKLIEEKRIADKDKFIHVWEENDPPVKVIKGRFGPYISVGKKNVKIPKDIAPEDLTLEKCLELEKAAPAKKRKARKKKK